ncbi:monocarboxylate transporter 13-like [Liolophura sinensis]|uniref:monocarboxylate transporter 13-like n=1 Tax=Liolophura sinensis TaxID=3198878 RepID=UPI003158260A
MSKTSTSKSTDDNSLSPTGGERTDAKERRPVALSPDTGSAWIVAFASMMNIFLQVGLYRSLGIFVVNLIEIYDAPTAKVSLIFTCVAIGFGATSILFICGFGDIFHERALVAAATFLAFVGHIVTFFSTRIEHIYAMGFCTGAAIQIAMACGLSLAGRYYDKRRTVASGIVMGGVSLGVLVFPPVLQWLLDEYTYRGTALISAGLNLNSLVCCSLMMPAPRDVGPQKVSPEQNDCGLRPAAGLSKFKDKTTESDLPTTATVSVLDLKPNHDTAQSFAANAHSNPAFVTEMEDFVSESQREVTQISRKENTSEDRRSEGCFEVFVIAVRRFSLKDTTDRPANVSVWKTLFPSVSLLKSPALLFFQIFVFCSTLCSECVVQFYPAFTRELGMSEYQSAFLLSMAGVGDLLSRVGLGLLGDYNFIARYKLVMIPQFILGTTCFLSRFATEFWSQGIFAVIIGLTYGTGYAFRAVILIDFFGLQKLNRLLGMSNFVTGLGFAAGSPLMGNLRDLTGDYKVPFQTLGAFLFSGGLSILVAGACIWRQRRSRCQYDLE